jgi:deoxyinosine 3'endonuclease (endonuclease V)
MQITDWTNYQIENADKVSQIDNFDIDKIKYVGGLDISFSKEDQNIVCGYLTIIDYITGNIVYEDHYNTKMDIPYISGYLGFREVPIYAILIEKLKQNNIELIPDVIMVDGFGILHQRCFGSASHLGIICDLPTIGVGKTLLQLDGLKENSIKKMVKKQCKQKGDYVYLIGNSKKEYGAALKSSTDSTNPIYVSIGHKITLDSAIKIVSHMCKYRIPEPIRNSDIKSKLYFDYK